MRGQIKNWFSEKGFGFIAQSGSPDVFVHATSFVMPLCGEVPPIGAVVDFKLCKNTKTGREMATEIIVLTDVDA